MVWSVQQAKEGMQIDLLVELFLHSPMRFLSYASMSDEQSQHPE